MSFVIQLQFLKNILQVKQVWVYWENRCLISPKFGSWVFIGGIFCNAEIETDSKLDIYCGDCDICIKSCPTGALSSRV